MKALLLFTLVIIIFCNCSKEEESKIELFYGEWEVEDLRVTRINGLSGPLFKSKFIMELNSDNCGTKYNLDMEETNILKWIYQETDERRDFLLSTLNSNTEGVSNLAKDNLYFVQTLLENEIILTRSIERMSNDTIFKTVWNLSLMRK